MRAMLYLSPTYPYMLRPIYGQKDSDRDYKEHNLNFHKELFLEEIIIGSEICRLSQKCVFNLC